MRRPARLATGLIPLALLTACGTPGATPVPSIGPSFAMPVPTQPAGDWFHDCTSSGADRVEAMACLAPHLEAVYAQAYAPLVEQRGVTWMQPTIVYPMVSAETACGTVKRPAYCPQDGTIVLPFATVATLDDRGTDLLLRIRGTWPDRPVLSRYVDVPEAELRSGAAASLVTAFAHEYAHHVQMLVGGKDRIDFLIGEDPDHEKAYLSAIELHADCLSAWATRVADPGTVTLAEEFAIISVVIAIGDDFGALAARTKAPDPLTYAHGSVQERVEAYLSGRKIAKSSGDPWPKCVAMLKGLLAQRARRSDSTSES